MKDVSHDKMNRGYFGIGIYRPKNTDNMGTLWRSAKLLGADFIFTIGERYKKQPTDTMGAVRHTPLFNYSDWDDFLNHIPQGSEVVCIEQTERSRSISSSNHPERAVYVLGAEDDGIPEEFTKGLQTIHIDTPRSLNVAVAGSIVMHHRYLQTTNTHH